MKMRLVIKKTMNWQNCHAWLEVKVKETVSGEAREVRREVHSIDYVKHSDLWFSERTDKVSKNKSLWVSSSSSTVLHTKRSAWWARTLWCRYAVFEIRQRRFCVMCAWGSCSGLKPPNSVYHPQLDRTEDSLTNGLAESVCIIHV